MNTLNCSTCGGPLVLHNDEKNIWKCEYCCSEHILPVQTTEELIYLLNNANSLRQMRRFVDAKLAYTTIINEYGDVIEAYFGRILSNAGIEYVDDGNSIFIPTCHRLTFSSILDEDDYIKLLSLCTSASDKKLYVGKANQIEKIRLGLIEQTKNVKPYDIFLCYKQSTNDGVITEDTQFGTDLYYELTNQGYNVFFSRISLDAIAGEKYEPIIFSAINSAKVMIVLFSHSAYIESAWVKNEWSRYIELVEKNKKIRGSLIPIYTGNGNIRLPIEFDDVQYLISNKIGFEKTLKNLVNKFTGVNQMDSSRYKKPARSMDNPETSEDQYLLGRQYLTGDGISQSYEYAVKWFKEAANKGHMCAQYFLGHCYYFGRGIAQSEEEAVLWYKRSANQQHAPAQYSLGICYFKGRGIEKSLKTAVKWYKKAAELGEADAQYALANCYHFGEGVDKLDVVAARWYKKAADQGNTGAMKNLGLCYEYGYGLSPSPKEAAQWYEKAADKGEKRAMYFLGNCYYNGKGVNLSYDSAVKYYQAASFEGDADAQYSLGKCYEFGHGVKKSWEKAYELYASASEQDHDKATVALAKLYDSGRGIKKSIKTANTLYDKVKYKKFDDDDDIVHKCKKCNEAFFEHSYFDNLCHECSITKLRRYKIRLNKKNLGFFSYVWIIVFMIVFFSSLEDSSSYILFCVALLPISYSFYYMAFYEYQDKRKNTFDDFRQILILVLWISTFWISYILGIVGFIWKESTKHTIMKRIEHEEVLR